MFQITLFDKVLFQKCFFLLLCVGLWVGLFLRWTEHAQNLKEAREEIWNIMKEHRERIGPDQTNHTPSTHCETFTPFENLMDELTIF